MNKEIEENRLIRVNLVKSFWNQTILKILYSIWIVKIKSKKKKKSEFNFSVLEQSNLNVWKNMINKTFLIYFFFAFCFFCSKTENFAFQNQKCKFLNKRLDIVLGKMYNVWKFFQEKTAEICTSCPTLDTFQIFF